MNRTHVSILVSSMMLATAGGCAIPSVAEVSGGEPTALTGAALTDTDDDAPAPTPTQSGVPANVLAHYKFWAVGGRHIPADPPARSACAAPLDAVWYDVVGCLDPSGNAVTTSGAAGAGVYCSANDGAGVTAVQSACLGGWLMTINAVNGVKLPPNVVLTGANKVAKAVTEVVLLECRVPPPGLSEHNVIYKAVYNDGIFAPEVPAGCTPYDLTAS